MYAFRAAVPSVEKILALLQGGADVITVQRSRHYDLVLTRWCPTQVEGAGEANRVAQALEAVGSTAWVDMMASDLTVAGMKAGVHNAQVLVLLLTINVLTRCVRVLDKRCRWCGEIIAWCDWNSDRLFEIASS